MTRRSPRRWRWLADRFAVEACHISGLNLVEASDPTIFDAARRANAIVLTKDRDFAGLVKRRGAPPYIIWITCGNTSNREIIRILEVTFERARALVASGEVIVEIKG